MSDEFRAIEEKKWVESDQEDSILQEVREYVKYGWPVKGKILEEIAPFFKVRDELEVDDTLLFKRGEVQNDPVSNEGGTVGEDSIALRVKFKARTRQVPSKLADFV
ncbi:hypothetical protein NDU88_005244 [Pleurodeles waltl]|uniref:Uncharacterized protein n=1 Tax=Pleurodeles waltl TaxID=8319 RepID=A0AAV7PM29_PLEWA|nr:hypothetical protein NDU88_005244 [Pleurodeles waltl]